MIAVLTASEFFSPVSKTVLSIFLWNAESGRVIMSLIPSRSLYSLTGGSPSRPASESSNVRIPVPPVWDPRISCCIHHEPSIEIERALINWRSRVHTCVKPEARVLFRMASHNSLGNCISSIHMVWWIRSICRWLAFCLENAQLPQGYKRIMMSAFALSSSIKSELSISPYTQRILGNFAATGAPFSELRTMAV